MGNSNLNAAKKAKNDEFYTTMPDIVAELSYYKGHFKNKVVYCNCDTKESNFVKYFTDNFAELGLKKLITSSLSEGTPFESGKGIELLKQCDIVVTNPPFSLFTSFFEMLMKYNKKFLIIGNHNVISSINVFPRYLSKLVWLGVTHPKEFIIPDKHKLKGSSYVNSIGERIALLCNTSWFTNLQHHVVNEEILLNKEYNESEYIKYDQYDAIEVSRTADIPKNYNGIMGVPISFLNKYTEGQFEIVGYSGGEQQLKKVFNKYKGTITINGIEPYRRIFIKHKKPLP